MRYQPGFCCPCMPVFSSMAWAGIGYSFHLSSMGVKQTVVFGLVVHFSTLLVNGLLLIFAPEVRALIMLLSTCPFAHVQLRRMSKTPYTPSMANSRSRSLEMASRNA